MATQVHPCTLGRPHGSHPRTLRCVLGAPGLRVSGSARAFFASAEAAARQLAAKWQQRWRKQGTARNPGTAQGLSVLITSWRLLAAKVKALRWAQGQSAAAAAAARRAHVLLHAQLQRADGG